MKDWVLTKVVLPVEGERWGKTLDAAVFLFPAAGIHFGQVNTRGWRVTFSVSISAPINPRQRVVYRRWTRHLLLFYS